MDRIDTSQDQTGQGAGQEHHTHRPGGLDLGEEGQAKGVGGNVTHGPRWPEPQGQQCLHLSDPVPKAVDQPGSRYDHNLQRVADHHP